MALFALIGLAMCIGVAWTMPNDLLRGVVVGAFLVAVPGTIWIVAVQLTGTAPTMMGDGAEQWTASELRRLTREGWLLINHVALSTDDIDHVLIGPGGVYAFETKWSGSWGGAYGRQRLSQAVDQARSNARRLGLWHPMKQLGIAPAPVVVLWGLRPAKWDDEDRMRDIDGVTVLAGSELGAWGRQLGREGLSPEQVRNAWKAIDEQAGRRDQSDAVRYPLPTSVAEWFFRLTTSVSAAAFGFVAVGQVLIHVGAAVLTSLFACVLLLPAALLRHSPRWRWLGWGWAGGVALPAVALLSAALITTVA